MRYRLRLVRPARWTRRPSKMEKRLLWLALAALAIFSVMATFSLLDPGRLVASTSTPSGRAPSSSR